MTSRDWMRKLRRSLVAPAVAAVAASAWLSLAGGEDGRSGVHQVKLRALGAQGRVVELRLDIVAVSEAEAATAGERAILTLGLEPIADEARVSAQWLPWTWQWARSELPVAVAYNPSSAPESVGPSAIIAGLQAWSNTGASSFAFRYAGITDNTASILESGPDGENVISWVSLPCDPGCVLGITSKLDAHEVDMVLNSNPQAAEQLAVGSRVDWRTVILHELGHMAGLEHSCPVPFGPCTPAEADAVMYFQYRGILRKLAEDDVAGLAALYPISSPTAGPTPPEGPAPASPPAAEVVVVLEEGWSLVTLPQENVEVVANALPCLRAVYRWDDQWTAWLRGAPEGLQGFSDVQAGRGYWAWSDGPCAHVFR